MVSLESQLARNRVLLADGATGTNLFAAGLTAGDPPDLWNIERPDAISGHYRLVRRGRRRRHPHQHFWRQRAAAEAAQGEGSGLRDQQGRRRAGARHSRRRRLVRSSSPARSGPTGELFVPLGAMTEEDAVAAFTEQAKGLKAGGADVCWIETMSAAEEMRAAAKGAIAAGMPYTVTASFDTAGRTMMGLAARRSSRGLCRSAAAAAGDGRELRCRRLRPSLFARADDRGEPGPCLHRQIELRNSASSRRARPLFRDAGADGRLCPPCNRRRRAHRRRLLRHDRRTSPRDAHRDRRTCTRCSP